jgi:signal transduction histidine kinase
MQDPSGGGPDDTRAAREARRLHEVKDELLRALAHDLRSPLGSLLVWLELLRGQELDPATARVAAKIENGVRDVRDMVLGFLEMAEIVSGTLAPELAPVDPAAVAEIALASSAASADAKGVRVARAVEPSLPPIRADGRCLRHGVGSLVANAVRATPPGGAIELRVTKENDRLVFRVHDSGPGLPPHELASLVETLRSGLTPDVGGLRLAVAVAVARLHGGTVHVTCGSGGGCVFALDLPIGLPAIAGTGSR